MQLNRAIVRIKNNQGCIVGAGFMVASRQILTCSHVINSALDLSEEPSQDLLSEAFIDFPFIDPQKNFVAKVKIWLPEEDIAGLELNTSTLSNVKPVRLITSEELWGHPFRVFGFPRGYDNGVWSTGVVRGQITNEWLQIEDTKSSGYRIQPGFSGSPVYDEVVGGVIGMITAAERDPNIRVGFIIPAKKLTKLWSEIPNYHVPSYQFPTSYQEQPEQIPEHRQLKVFLCHASDDKPKVQNLYHRLRNDGIKPWLDKENLLPGQKWRLEIPKAVRTSDVVIICLSRNSVTKAGYVQKEIRYALDIADEKPEGVIFLIPLRLEECEVPERLRDWHWVDLFEEKGYERLMRTLQQSAQTLNLNLPHSRPKAPETMLVNLLSELRQKTVDFLLSLPNGGYSQQDRLALAYSSGLDAELISQIDFSGPGATFFQLLVNTLVAYGQLADGRHALIAVLKAAKKFVGAEKQHHAAQLIEAWQTNIVGIEEIKKKIELLTPQTKPIETRKIAEDLARNYNASMLAKSVESLNESFNRMSSEPTTQYWIATAIGKASTLKALDILRQLKLSSEGKHPLVIHGIDEAIKNIQIKLANAPR